MIASSKASPVKPTYASPSSTTKANQQVESFQFSSRLTSLCPGTRTCGVFCNRILLSTSGGQLTAVVIDHIVLEALGTSQGRASFLFTLPGLSFALQVFLCIMLLWNVTYSCFASISLEKLVG